MQHEIACSTLLVNPEDNLQENIIRNILPEGPKTGEGSPGPEPVEAGGSENGHAHSSSEEPPLLLGRPMSSGRRVRGASADIKAGGRPCNTSPADQHAHKEINKLEILCGGVDTLELTALITWEPESILESLKEMRKNQECNHLEIHGEIKTPGEEQDFYYTLKTQSTRFMTYILIAPQMHILLQKDPDAPIGHNCQVKIRSEALWEKGYQGSLDYFIKVMKCAGATVNVMKVSRVDMCVDALVPEQVFKALPTHYVTLAKGDPMQYGVDPINSFYLGKGGNITVRLYDKAKEIEEVSGKHQMKEVWGIQEVPTGHRVMRIEAQIKRDTLREFGVSTTGEFKEKQGEIWKYITEKWLQYKDAPGRETWRRKVSPWWKMVQEGYPGSKQAKIALRSHITEKNIKMRFLMAKHYLEALHAAQREEEGNDGYYETVADTVATFALMMKKYDLGNENITAAIMEKRKKIRRTSA